MVQTHLCEEHPGLVEGVHHHHPGQLGDDGQGRAGRAALHDQFAADWVASRVEATETTIHGQHFAAYQERKESKFQKEGK